MGRGLHVNHWEDGRQVNEDIIVVVLGALNISFIAGEFRMSELLEGLICVEDGRKSNLYLESVITRSSKSDFSATMLSRPGTFV